jgi:DNA-binding MarR family transcriptional regulator
MKVIAKGGRRRAGTTRRHEASPSKTGAESEPNAERALEASPFTGITYYVMSIANLIAKNTTQRTLAGSGLTLNEWRVLRFVTLFTPALASDVIATIGMDKTTVSRAIARLHAAKLVALEPNPADRRETRLTLTERGRQLHAKLYPIDRAFDASFEKELTRKELAVLRPLLAKLHHHARALLG